MAGAKRQGEIISSINVTPFVDIVLVLLIILMVTSTHIVKASLAIELPKAASGGEAIESALNIVVTKENEILLGGDRIDEKTLISAVRREKEKNPLLQAVISADKGVPYGAVVDIIDLVKLNGVKNFVLNIERKPRANRGE